MADPDPTRWIRAGWLIDGTGQPVVRNALIGVRDGILVSVGPAGSTSIDAVDLSNSTLLPALMDAHVHLAFSGSLDDRVRTTQLEYTLEAAEAAVCRHLKDQWRHGVVAVRDGGDRLGATLHYKQTHDPSEEVLAEDVPAERVPVTMKAGGWAWHAPGRYGRMLGRAVPPGTSPAEAVFAQIDAIDHLKIIQSGVNSIDRFGHATRPQFDEDALRAMADVAHRAGRPVMVHANGELPVRLAIAAGCDSIEHGYFMGEENLRRMADQGVCWVPTVVPMSRLTEASNLRSDQIDIARRTVDHQLDQIRKAVQFGVTIALGTDAGSQGVDHGAAVRQELALLMDAGMRLAEAVQCATGHAARLMRLADRGELRPGGRADFLVVDGSPDRLPEGLAHIASMWIGGRRIQ